MVITLKDSSSALSDIVLVHGAGKPSSTYAQGPVGGEEVFESSVVIQVVPIIRAAAARVRARGNRTASYPFAALREFSSYGNARAWAAAHAAALDGYDRLAITADSATTTLTGALSPVRCTLRGVSVLIDYTFIFGATS